MAKARWTVAEAKAKFSEVLERAEKEGPQRITKHGRETAVVVSAEEWAKKTKPKESLAEFREAQRLRPEDPLSRKRIEEVEARIGRDG